MVHFDGDGCGEQKGLGQGVGALELLVDLQGARVAVAGGVSDFEQGMARGFEIPRAGECGAIAIGAGLCDQMADRVGDDERDGVFLRFVGGDFDDFSGDFPGIGGFDELALGGCINPCAEDLVPFVPLEDVGQGMAVESLGGICGLGDMEQEVVAEEPVGVLNLEEMKAGGRQVLEADLNGFAIGFQGAGCADAIHKEIGVVANVAATDFHGMVAWIKGGELLCTRLFFDRPECPESRLWFCDVALKSHSGRECANKAALLCESEKSGTGISFSIAGHCDVRAAFVLGVEL